MGGGNTDIILQVSLLVSTYLSSPWTVWSNLYYYLPRLAICTAFHLFTNFRNNRYHASKRRDDCTLANVENSLVGPTFGHHLQGVTKAKTLFHTVCNNCFLFGSRID